ncbi:MAG: hypothetical protein QM785_15045 [Pyrinomonadaceae bacterium]
MIKNISAALALAILIAVAAACNGSFTTANISELKFGKNNKADPSSTTFNTGEDIYALATVSNAPEGKYKLTWKITYEDVAGKSKGAEVGTNTVDFEGSKQLWQSFSSPLPGEYAVEATLSDAEGKKIESKSGRLSIKGSAPTTPSESDKKKADTDDSH